MTSLHISNDMIEHFKTCAKAKNFRIFYDDHIDFIFNLSSSLKMISIDETPHSFIVKHLRDFFLYLGHVDVNHKGSYVRGSYGLEKSPGLEICADIKNTVITENWSSFFEKYQNIADSIIDAARNQNIVDLCIELGDDCYPNFSSRERARKGSESTQKWIELSDNDDRHRKQPYYSQKKYKVYKSVPQRAFYSDTCSRCTNKRTMIGPFSWTGLPSYSNSTPTSTTQTGDRSILSPDSTPSDENSSSESGSYDITTPYSDVSVFEFDRTVFDSNQLFNLLRKPFADNSLTESNNTQDTSPIEDYSMTEVQVSDDFLRDQVDESPSDNNEESCSEQISGESVTDSTPMSSSFESGSSTHPNSDVSTNKNETTVDESNKKSNVQLLSLNNQLNQLLILLKKRAQSHFEDLHDTDTEKKTSDVNIHESTHTETQFSSCDIVQRDTSNLPISVHEEHRNDENSRPNESEMPSNINVLTSSRRNSQAFSISESEEGFGPILESLVADRASYMESQNQNALRVDHNVDAMIETFQNMLGLSETVVQNQERLIKEVRELEEINGEIENLSAEPKFEATPSTELNVPEVTQEQQASDSEDDNFDDPEFEEKLREQEERHKQEWEALMKKRKSKR